MIVGILCLAGLSQITRSDKPDDFAFLASALFVELPADGNAPIRLTAPEEVVKLRKQIARLDHMARRSQTLAPIASKFGHTLKRAEALGQKSPEFSKFLFGLAEAGLGAYSGQRDRVGTGGQKALVAAETGVNYLKEQGAVLDEKRVLAVEMLDLVPKFSGAVTTTPAFSYSFEERQTGFLEIQSTLRMVNTSGRELHNCVVAVRLSNVQGVSALSLYFANNWRNAEMRMPVFSNLDFSQQPIIGLNRVEVQIWASEFSVEPFVLSRQGQPGVRQLR